MTEFLLDTSVLSEFAPDKRALPESVGRWLSERTSALYVSAISFTEIEQGVRKLQRVGGRTRAARLSTWLDRLAEEYADRIVTLDAKVARIAGVLGEAALAVGRHPGLADVLIAASAHAHALTILSRNTRHFEPLGVSVVDPFAIRP